MNTDVNPLNLRHHEIYVRGNLIVKSKLFPSLKLNSRTYASESDYPNAEIFEGDLVIDDCNKLQYSSLTTYATQKDICYHFISPDSIQYPNGPAGLIPALEESFLQALSKADDNSGPFMLQSLYINIFSRFEYALIKHTLFNLKFILGDILDIFKENNEKRIKAIKNSNIPDGEKEEKLIQMINQNIHGGNLPLIRGLFKAILKEDVDIPDCLRCMYVVRNDIVHRLGCDLNTGIPRQITIHRISETNSIISNLICKLTNHANHIE